MGDGFQFLDIVFFAMVAAFLVLRLRSVLGRKTGNEQPRVDPMTHRSKEREAEGNGNVVDLPTRPVDERPAPSEIDPSDPMAAGLTRIRIADNSFDPPGFLQGARAAFEMVVQAFATADTQTLKNLLAEDVFENFNEAIQERLAAKETLETTIIGIRKAEIVEADMDGNEAFVTVKFVTEQVNVTRDAEGRVVDGDPNHVSDVTDIWTFRRDTTSRDPNWKLTETRSQN